MTDRKLTNKHDALKAIDKYAKDGFHFSAPTAKGYDNWHCYPTIESTAIAKRAVSKLFDDIDSKGYDILFDIQIDGDDDGYDADGLFTLEIYDWDSMDHVTIWFDRDRDEETDLEAWYLKLYHVPKSEEHKLGFKMESDDISEEDMIVLWEWLIERRKSYETC